MATVTPGDCPHTTDRARARRRRVEGKGRKNFPCQLCEKAFNSVEKLKVHSYSHTGERPYRCTHADCTKAFVSKYKLLRHMATHSPEKTHKCSYCEKMFHRKDHLKNHLHTHDPNKEAFTCDECGKSYNTKLGFKRHLALHAAHSGDLTCQVCLQTYPSTSLLLEHLRGHAGKSSSAAKEKRHQCEHCERRFYTRKDVRRHMVVHTGRKDFLCQYCAQRFGRKDHLTRHVKKSHAPELLLAVKAEPLELDPIACQLPPAPCEMGGSVKDELSIVGGGMFGPSPPPPMPLSLRYPLGPVSYSPPPPLRADLETYLMELQNHLPPEPGHSEDTPLPKISSSGTLAGDTLGSSSLDFSQLFNFLPLNGPCYNQGAGPALGVSYQAEEGLPHLAPPIPLDPSTESVSSMHTLSSAYVPAASLNTTTTLPRFHQAFQ
ncbi:zinc finger protein PLAG1 [Denticeps clupeoides]|uniref:C2H2-type domain-containing protein n=1 Tax=Denticeps clupeoides TaxID=299321 RepID=A0AAY4E2S5_9TELE|nr:zinc finger protein PLAG1 [Denticeps clupeoides]